MHCLLSVRSSPSEAPPALGMAFSLFLSSSLAKKDGEVGDAQGDSHGCPCLCSPALHGEAWPELLLPAEGEEPASSESAALSLDEKVGEPRPPPSCKSDGRRASGSSKRRLFVQEWVCMRGWCWTSVSTAARMQKLRSVRQRAMSGMACPLRRVSGGPRSSKRRQ